MPTYFNAVRDRLTFDGVAMIHSITSESPSVGACDFAYKYFDATGRAPSLSEVFAAVEKTGLWALDGEALRLHYAKTLEAWSGRLAHCCADVVARYDERLARLWEYYLGSAESSFTHGSLAVTQVLLGSKRGNVPVMRCYVEADKARLIVREKASGWDLHVAIHD